MPDLIRYVITTIRERHIVVFYTVQFLSRVMSYFPSNDFMILCCYVASSAMYFLECLDWSGSCQAVKSHFLYGVMLNFVIIITINAA